MGETPKTALPPQDRAASVFHNIKKSSKLFPAAACSLFRSIRSMTA
ncbi:hypothetical protein BJP36_41225 [Moorena producens JHB]|uniref:Uncharacterized protein n=1 Tax=Moorena producens (strain JHB) TaxID=1454205 RepID=A0A9Q9SSD5_MOOP1|nr:hypothetical protein [Moorena producens]WAN68789.1 hypothetical protein BJP36_41225 [Moorena producens JHB]